jgi:hypothetical protein
MVLKIGQLGNCWWPGSEKTRGEKMKATSIMLLKTNVEKMPETGLSIMLMKKKELQPSFHYVDDNKASYKK